MPGLWCFENSWTPLPPFLYFGLFFFFKKKENDCWTLLAMFAATSRRESIMVSIVVMVCCFMFAVYGAGHHIVEIKKSCFFFNKNRIKFKKYIVDLIFIY
jgi:hypothetical protein